MSITAIITGYNRPDALPVQIEAIKNQSIPADDMLFWYNKGEQEQIDLEKENPNIKGVYANHNFKFHGRFSLALMAKTEYIALFDDDSIPGKDWFKSCLETMKTHEGILGSTGVYLFGNNYTNHTKYGWNLNQVNEVKEVDLVGHSWFFKREWLQYLWKEMPLSWDNGEDIMFSMMCWKHGGIRTFVPPHPKENKDVWGTNPKYGWCVDDNATYRKNKGEHLRIRNYLCDQYTRNGYTTVKNRK
jgi:glycosyl transferase family 2